MIAGLSARGNGRRRLNNKESRTCVLVVQIGWPNFTRHRCSLDKSRRSERRNKIFGRKSFCNENVILYPETLAISHAPNESLWCGGKISARAL